MAIPSAKALLGDTNGRPYMQRVSRAVQVGVTNRNNAQLTRLIGDLRKHPDAEVPEVETDDGFSELLPPQSTNVAPFYHQDMLALYAASASKTHLEVLKEELTSSSRFFKKLAVKEVVRQETDDQALVDLILRVVPNVRTKMIHACIRYRRTAVLDAAFPKLIDRLGVDYVAPWCHGLSSDVLTEALNTNVELLNSSALNWGKIAKFSMDVVANRMEQEFKAKDDPFEYFSVWQVWHLKGLTTEQSFSCGPTTADGKLDASYKINQRPTAVLLMDLEARFPAYVYTGGAPPIANVDSDDHVAPDKVAHPRIGVPFVRRYLPQLIADSNNLRFFNRTCSDTLFDHFEATLHLDHCERLRSSMPGLFWYSCSNISFERTERFLRKIVAESSFNSMFTQAWSKRSEKAKLIPRYYLEVKPSIAIDRSSHYHQYVEKLEEFFSAFGVVEELEKNRGVWQVGLRDHDEKSHDDELPVDRVWNSSSLLTDGQGERFFWIKLSNDLNVGNVKGITFKVTRVWGRALERKYANPSAASILDPPPVVAMDSWMLSAATYLEVTNVTNAKCHVEAWSPAQLDTLVTIGFDLLEKSMPPVEFDDPRVKEWMTFGQSFFNKVVETWQLLSGKKRVHKIKKGAFPFEVTNKYWAMMRGACARYASILMKWRSGHMEKLIKFAKVHDRLTKLAAAVTKNANRDAKRQATSPETTKLVFKFWQKLQSQGNQPEPLATVDELDDAVRELERLYEANHGDVRTHMNLNSAVRTMRKRYELCKSNSRAYFYGYIGTILDTLLTDPTDSEMPLTPEQTKEGLDDAVTLYCSFRPAPPEDSTELAAWVDTVTLVPTLCARSRAWLRWRHPNKAKAKKEEIDCGPNSVKLREKNAYRACIKTALAFLSTFYREKYASQKTKDALANQASLQKIVDAMVQTLADESKAADISLFVTTTFYDGPAHDDIEPLRVIKEFNTMISKLVLSPWNPLDITVDRIAEEWASVRRAIFSSGSSPSHRQFCDLQACVTLLRGKIYNVVIGAYSERYVIRASMSEFVRNAPYYSDDLKKLIGDHFTLLEDLRPVDPLLGVTIDKGTPRDWRNAVSNTFSYWLGVLSDYAWQHQQADVGDVLELVIARSVTLIRSHFRQGLDERISTFEKLFEQFDAFREEQVNLRKARQKESDFEPEQDVVDIYLHNHIRALLVKLNNDVNYDGAKEVCAEFVDIVRSQTRNTPQEVKTDLGTEFSNGNVDDLSEVCKRLETLYLRAQEDSFTYDRVSLNSIAGIMTQLRNDPRLWMRLFRELVPVFVDSQPRPFPADERNSTLNAAKNNYLNQVSTLGSACLSRLSTYRDAAKKWEEEKEHDPEKRPPIALTEVDAFIEETFQYFFDYFLRAFEEQKHARCLIDLLHYANGDTFAKSFEKLKSKLTVDHIDMLKTLMIHKSTKETEAEWMLVFSSFRDIPEPLKHIPVLASVMVSATPVQRLAIFKSFDHSRLNHLAQQSPNELTAMLDALHLEPTKVLEETRTLVSKWLVELVTKKIVSKVTKDLLLKYQDITVSAVRKDLERASDSNSIAQRNAALETLVAATLLCNEDARLMQGKRTLSFFRKRLKNETVENRADGLKILLEPRESITALVKTEYTEIWSDLLSDALQSSDLDQQPEDDASVQYGGYHVNEYDNPAGAEPECWSKHRVLKHFFRVSKAAISYGTADTKGTFFDFGVELQWRISLFRLGQKKASERFRISFASALLERGSQYELHPDRHFKEHEEGQFVEGWIDAYEKRIGERNADFLKHTISSYTYLKDLFDIIGKNAYKLPTLRDHLQLLFERIKKQRDLILNDDVEVVDAEQQDVDMVDEFTLKQETDCGVLEAMAVFWTILRYNRKTWSDIDVFREYIETLFVVARSTAPDRVKNKKKSDAYRQICNETFTFFNELIRLFHHNQLPLKFGQKAIDWWTDDMLSNYARSFLDVIRNTPPRDEAAEFTTLEKNAVQIFDKLMSDNGKEWHKVDLCCAYVDTLAEVFSHAKIRENQMAEMERVAVRVLPSLAALATEGPRWHDIPSLVRLAESVLSVLKSHPKKDHEGLLIVESSCEPITCIESLFRANHGLAKKKMAKHWQYIPVLKDYVETMLRSRQALVVLFRWFHVETAFTKSRKERQQARNAVVEKLLSISKSSIYLKFVWSHLVRWRQDLLDEYLNSGRCFRGVYYQDPSERSQKHKKKKAAAASTPPTPGRRTYGLGRGIRTEPAQVGVDDVQGVVDSQKLAEQEFDQEKLYWIQRREKESEDMKTDEDGDVDPDVLEQRRTDAAFDHEDMFCVQGCYGLHRLLPEQNQKLAKQRIAQVLNADRSRPERVKAAIRLTLIPSVTYPTVLAFMQRHEFSINVIEALLKGFLQNKDDILAPLHFLLSPDILSSDRSRVAIYSVSQCVPHMKPNVFSGLLKQILTGKRRNALKVTAYKEIIRLLITNPTRKHINMITHEWKRQVLHRDVRIAILQAAFKFLLRSREIRGAEDACWRIFESALDGDLRSNVEILSTLVGVKPVISSDNTTYDDPRFMATAPTNESIVLQPRISEHIETFAEVEIPSRHVERYTRSVVLKLCNRINMVTKEELPKQKAKKSDDKDTDGDTKMAPEKASEKDDDGDAKMESECIEKTHREDDLAFLAFASLPRWMKAGYGTVEPMKLLYDVVTDDSEDFTNNLKTDVQTVNNNRWSFCARYFLSFSGLAAKCESVDKESLMWVSNAIKSLCESIKNTEIADRDRRIVLISRLDLLLDSIEPYFELMAAELGKDSKFFDALENSVDNMWWRYVMRYHSNTLYEHCDDQTSFNQLATSLIARQIGALQDYPHYFSDVVTNVNTILARSFDFDPDYVSDPVTPTIEFVRSYIEQVISEAGRTSDINVLLRREVAIAVFCVSSPSSTYFSSALSYPFLEFLTDVVMPACIETVNPTVTSFAERFSLSGVTYNAVRFLFDNAVIHTHLATTLIRLSKQQSLTTESVVFYNIAAHRPALLAALATVPASQCPKLLLALLDITLITESSLPAVPPLLFPSYDSLVLSVYKSFAERASSPLNTSYDRVVVEVVKSCLEWPNVHRVRGEKMRTLAAVVVNSNLNVRKILINKLSVKEYCQVVEMVLLGKLEKVDDTKYFSAKDVTRDQMKPHARQVSDTLLAICKDSDRLWKEKQVVTSKVQRVLKEVLKRALATKVNESTSTVRSMCFYNLVAELWELSDFTTHMLFAAFNAAGIRAFLQKRVEVGVIHIKMKLKANEHLSAAQIAREVKRNEESIAHNLISTQLRMLLESRSKQLDKNGHQERIALKKDARSVVAKLVQLALKPYNNNGDDDDDTPLWEAVLARACIKTLLGHIAFVSEIAPESVTPLIVASAQARDLVVPVDRWQLERKSNDVESSWIDERVEVLVTTLRSMFSGARAHGLPLTILEHRVKVSCDMLKDIGDRALEDDQPIFRRTIFTVFKVHHEILDHMPLERVSEFVMLLIRDNDASIDRSTSTAMNDDDDDHKEGAAKHKPSMSIKDIVRVVEQLVDRRDSVFLAKREIPPQISELVRSIVKSALDEASTIDDYNDLESLASMPFLRTTNAFISEGIEFLAIAAQSDIPALVDIFIKTYAVQCADDGGVGGRRMPEREILKAVQGACAYLNPARANQRRTLGVHAAKIIHDYVAGGIRACTDPELHNAMHGRKLPTMSSVYFNLLTHLDKSDHNLIALASLHASAPDNFLENFLHALMVGTPSARSASMAAVLSALELATRPDKTKEQEKSKISSRLIPIALSTKFMDFVDRLLLQKLRPAQPNEHDIETANYRIQLLACAFDAVQKYPHYVAQRSDVLSKWMMACVSAAFRTNPKFSLAPLADIAISHLRSVEQYADLVARERKYNQDEAAPGFKQRKNLSLTYDSAMPWSEALIVQVADWVKHFREIAARGNDVVRDADRVAFARNARQAGLDVLIKYGPKTQAQIEAPSKGGSVLAKTVWQESLVELLDLYCVDTDPDIRRQALTQNTETWGKAKAPTGAARSGLGAPPSITVVRGGRGRGRRRGRGRGAVRGSRGRGGRRGTRGRGR